MHHMLNCLSVLAAFGVLLIAPLPARAQEDTPAPALLAAVNIIVPELYRTPAGEDNPTRVPAPTVLAEGDRLLTDASGVVLITWINNGTETILDSDTMLTVTRLAGVDATDAQVEVELSAGRVIAGAPALPEGARWHLTTPALSVTPLAGRFDITVERDGTTLLIVTTGQVEVSGPDGASHVLSENEYLSVTPGDAAIEPAQLSSDGVSVSVPGVCTATAATNVNVRAAPSEESRRLGGIKAGEVLWVRAATGGNLWLNVYYEPARTAERSAFGWIYGPAALLSADCGTILRAPLDAVLFDGPGIMQHEDAGAEASPAAPEAEAGAEIESELEPEAAATVEPLATAAAE